MREKSNVYRRACGQSRSATRRSSSDIVQQGGEVDGGGVDKVRRGAQGGRNAGHLTPPPESAATAARHAVRVVHAIGQSGADPDPVRLSRPGGAVDRPEPLGGICRRARRGGRIVRELRTGEVQLGLRAGLQHPMRSEDARHPLERALGLGRQPGLAEHLGAIEIADGRVDRRRLLHDGAGFRHRAPAPARGCLRAGRRSPRCERPWRARRRRRMPRSRPPRARGLRAPRRDCRPACGRRCG